MDKIVDKILSIPGVTGCYIFGLTEGIQAGHGTPDGKALRKISIEISQMVDAFGTDDNIPKTLRISYEKGEITLKRAGSFFIVVFHNPTINISLLRIAMNVASYETKKSVRR